MRINKIVGLCFLLVLVIMDDSLLSNGQSSQLAREVVFHPYVELEKYFKKELRSKYKSVKFFKFSGKSLKKYSNKVASSFPISLRYLEVLNRDDLFEAKKFLTIFYDKNSRILGGAFLFKGSVLSCFVCDKKGRWIENICIVKNRLIKKEWSYHRGRLFSWKKYIYKKGKFELLKTNIYTPEIDYFIEAAGVSFKIKRTYLRKALLRKRRILKFKKRKLIPFKMGSRIVYFEEFLGKKNDRTFLFVHPDEVTAYRGLKKYLLKNHATGYLFIGKGERLSRRGRYLAIKIGRKIFYFDPNRIFSDKRKANFFLTKKFYRYAIYNRSYYYRRYRHLFYRYIRVFHEFIVSIAMVRQGPLIAVHDNDEVMKWANKIFSGHNYGISKLSYHNKKMKTSDFVYVTGLKDYEYYKKNYINVILQDNDKIKDDGSASIEFARKKKRYMCIEVKRNGRKSHEIIQKMLQLAGDVK